MVGQGRRAALTTYQALLGVGREPHLSSVRLT
jgi:hypothetical protein